MGFVRKLTPTKEIVMRSSSTSGDRTDRPRRATPKALVWLMVAALAAFPFPWWW
jgi:hypothetical protein